MFFFFQCFTESHWVSVIWDVLRISDGVKYEVEPFLLAELFDYQSSSGTSRGSMWSSAAVMWRKTDPGSFRLFLLVAASSPYGTTPHLSIDQAIRRPRIPTDQSPQERCVERVGLSAEARRPDGGDTRLSASCPIRTSTVCLF